MWKYFVPTIIFLIDRILKIICARLNLEGDFLNFGLYKNYAGAFSLPIAGWLYNAMGIILLGIFFYFLIKEIKIPPTPLFKRGAKGNLKILSFVLIILGGASNLYDRLVYGFTIDYVNFLNFSFFNIADGMLLGGIILLLFANKKRMPPQNSKSQIPNSK